jgi:hypothetical protein
VLWKERRDGKVNTRKAVLQQLTLFNKEVIDESLQQLLLFPSSSDVEVVFLIPIRHHNSVQDYSHTWSMLQRTLFSLSSQDCDSWHAVVCGNKILPLDHRLTQSKITCLQYNGKFVGYTVDKWDEEHIKKHIQDKAIKRQCGVMYASEHVFPKWYFMLDADDIVANDLVSSIKTRTLPRHRIIKVNNGLMVRDWQYYQTDAFNTFCGSSVGCLSSFLNYQISSNHPSNLVTLLGLHNTQKYYDGVCSDESTLCLIDKPYCAYMIHNENHSKNTWKYKDRMDKVELSNIDDEILDRFPALVC